MAPHDDSLNTFATIVAILDRGGSTSDLGTVQRHSRFILSLYSEYLKTVGAHARQNTAFIGDSLPQVRRNQSQNRRTMSQSVAVSGSNETPSDFAIVLCTCPATLFEFDQRLDIPSCRFRWYKRRRSSSQGASSDKWRHRASQSSRSCAGQTTNSLGTRRRNVIAAAAGSRNVVAATARSRNLTAESSHHRTTIGRRQT